MKAWAIYVNGFDDMVAAADTRSAATYLAFRGAQEAGYSITFANIRTARCGALDEWAVKQEKPCLRAMTQARWELP